MLRQIHCKNHLFFVCTIYNTLHLAEVKRWPPQTVVLLLWRSCLFLHIKITFFLYMFYMSMLIFQNHEFAQYKRQFFFNQIRCVAVKSLLHHPGFWLEPIQTWVFLTFPLFEHVCDHLFCFSGLLGLLFAGSWLFLVVFFVPLCSSWTPSRSSWASFAASSLVFP